MAACHKYDLRRGHGVQVGFAAYVSETQMPLRADDLTAASMNFMPARPSSTVGKLIAGSGFVPTCAERMARAASA